MLRLPLSIGFMIWTFPNTLLGVVVGGMGLLTGGQVQIIRNCVEFHGGGVAWLLKRMPPGQILAITLGHSILGQTANGLEIARDHEHVHVKQYERWGPLFIPAYLACSGWLWFQGRDYYRENPFEVEAYTIADPGKTLKTSD